MFIAVTSPPWFRNLLSKRDSSLILQPVYITGLCVVQFELCCDVLVISEPCSLECESPKLGECAYDNDNDVSSYAIAECFGTGFYNNGQSLDQSISNTSMIFANKVRLLNSIISCWCCVVLVTQSEQIDGKWVFNFSAFVPKNRSCDCVFGYKVPCTLQRNLQRCCASARRIVCWDSCDSFVF